MAQQRRKKPHQCKNHKRRAARGRCPVCRKWICRECAVLHKGNFICKDTCSDKKESVPPVQKKLKAKKVTAPKKTATKPAQPIKKPPETVKEKSLLKSMLFWTALTLGFGGIAFGLIELRKNQDLEKKIQMYKKSRSRLIKLVKKRNAYIRKLKGEKTTAKQEDEIKETITGVQKRKRVSVSSDYSQPQYHYEPGKLPISFDNGTSVKKLIALTFDGGGHKNAAKAILDTLRSRDVPATMFLTGRFIRKNSELVRDILADGHEIGNHLATHPHLTSWGETRTQTTLPEISVEMIGRELIITNKCYKKVTGADMAPFWRAPYGEKNREICQWAQQFGYLHIGWKQARYWRQNFDTNDWVPDPETPGYYTPEETLIKFNALADLQPHGMNGAIILMHLGTVRKEKKEQIHLILGTLIDQLHEKGYEFVPVSVLLKESGVDISMLRPHNADLADSME